MCIYAENMINNWPLSIFSDTKTTLVLWTQLLYVYFVGKFFDKFCSTSTLHLKWFIIPRHLKPEINEGRLK